MGSRYIYICGQGKKEEDESFLRTLIKSLTSLISPLKPCTGDFILVDLSRFGSQSRQVFTLFVIPCTVTFCPILICKGSSFGFTVDGLLGGDDLFAYPFSNCNIIKDAYIYFLSLKRQMDEINRIGNIK